MTVSRLSSLLLFASRLLGPARERIVHSRPSRLIVRVCQSSSPNGRERTTETRTSSSSFLGRPRFTRAFQSAGLPIGHEQSAGLSSSSPGCSERQRLLNCHWSARATRPARRVAFHVAQHR